MRRWLGITTVAVALATALATGAGAQTRTYFGFNIGVTNAPGPRYVHMPPPDLYYEPQAQVYVVQNSYDGYDMFRYGSAWYACDGDYWYRASSYRGPFYACDVRAVPQAIFYVPSNDWHRYPRPLTYWRNTRYSGGAAYAHGYGYPNRTYGYSTSYPRYRDEVRYRDEGQYRERQYHDDRNTPPGWSHGRKNGWDKHGKGHGGHDRD